MDFPILILNGSKRPYLSTACYCGGFTNNGIEYRYLPKHDCFIMKKHLSKLNKHLKAGLKISDFDVKAK
jgi:hypothetical protein